MSSSIITISASPTAVLARVVGARLNECMTILCGGPTWHDHRRDHHGDYGGDFYIVAAIPAVITARKFKGGLIACHSFIIII